MTVSNEIKLFFRQIFTIAGKDFRYLVFSPLFFSWTGVSCILLSYIFPRDLFRFASSYIAPSFGQSEGPARNIYFEVFVSHISYLNLILLFSVPVLAMKLLAEEKRNRSFDLLMSAPVSSVQMVLGKYLSLLTVLGLFLLVSLVYPFSTALFAKIPFQPLLGAYLGLFLLSAVYGAVGLFASSLSRSLFLSAFLGMILNISLWFFSTGTGLHGGPVGSVMDYLSLSQHLTNFIKASLVLSSFVFFFCVIAFFLFLVFKTVELSRWRS